jgi:hypothetical protein
VLRASKAMRFYLDVNTLHLTGGSFANHVFCWSKANMRTPIFTEEHGKRRSSFSAQLELLAAVEVRGS